MAVVSYAHTRHEQSGLPSAHGIDAISAQLGAGTVAIDEVSIPGKRGYAQPDWGFWNTYLGSELQLGILATGKTPTPGPACDEPALRAGLGPLLDLARQDTLKVEDAAGYPQLCVCAGSAAADGLWLARLMCGDAGVLSDNVTTAARRDTVLMVARVMDTHPVTRVSADVAGAIAFGSFAATDPVLSEVSATPAWRGALLRNYSVGAWRRIWSWLVREVAPVMPAAALADRFAEQFPAGTVANFMAHVPPTMQAGQPVPAERDLRAQQAPVPSRELAVLIAGARRTNELEGTVRDAFLGQRGIDLGPEWVARRLSDCSAMPMRDFARTLCDDLLARARRVSWRKARRRADGSLWLPARLHERGDSVFKTSDEGAGDVGIRLEQLTTVLAGCGVLVREDGLWRPTPAGRVLLDLPS